MEETKIRELINRGRAFTKPSYSEEYNDETYYTDQELKKQQPPLVKEPNGKKTIDLPMDFTALNINNDFLNVINSRASHRVYTEETMTLTELSYLLWCSQGIKEIRGKAYATLRTVPCGGARHEFEVYLTLQNVEGVPNGFYHYLPMSHKLELIKEQEDLKDFISESLQEQVWAAKANAVFYISAVYYRAEWRYGIYAHRVLLIDAGHITENLYLASTSIHLGGCAIGAVVDSIANEAFGLDGIEECIIYAHPIGKVSVSDKEKEQDFYAFVKEQGL